ncbi:NADP-dependent aldehyde dehydrogenase [Gordonia amarae]|uniref:Putative oxidoreductase n=1 Tax=Gordonia amarae NBRC 15530 TaxID=1075090 RepID=G7GLF4_9ACTN|nr:FAD-dependent oxidoreductase [Gordonia amarae]MCS3878952.1 NADP-dependent aldehyde dehydrogenase [Gordonia amarae]GAB04429.1 putative oxidoreductase [Gordonia amarae NBRC 15530]
MREPDSAASGIPVADVAVVGAGPAGLAATVAAADAGLTVTLIDSAAQTGGQFWRHPDERTRPTDENRGHHLWRTYTGLRDTLRMHVGTGRISALFSRQVWFLEPPADPSTPFTLHLTASFGAHQGPAAVRARRLILCTGGYDRQLPVPGWDLPGVMAAGGVQALLKAHRTVAGARALVAGTGPFLLPVATGLAQAGAEVVAVCEAAAVIRGWARNPLGALAMPAKAIEGAEYAYHLARHRIPYRTCTVVTAVHGDDRVTSATLARLGRDGRIDERAQTVDVDLVAFGWGFTPSLELITAAGAATRVDVDGSLVAVVDAAQRSTVPGVYVAGEATGVGGAALAVAEGELAGTTAAVDGGHREPHPRTVRTLTSRITRGRRFAAAMHTAHPVPEHWQDWLRPDTLVCRCEETTFGSLQNARDDLGAADARTAKLIARPGMGWCQGRVCGFATAAIASPCGRPGADELAPIAKRVIAAPVTLGELAGDDAATARDTHEPGSADQVRYDRPDGAATGTTATEGGTC